MEIGFSLNQIPSILFQATNQANVIYVAPILYELSRLEEEDEHGISMILADVGSQFIASLYLSHPGLLCRLGGVAR